MVGYGENGSVVGPQNLPTGGFSGVASGVWSMGEVAEASRDELWPKPFNPESYVAIATFSGSSTNSIEFTSIPIKYSTLRVRVVAETDVNYGHYTEVTVNGYAGSYNSANTRAYSNSVSLATMDAQQTEWFPYLKFPNMNTGSSLNFPNSGEYWFPNANSTTTYKSASWAGVYKRTTTYSGNSDDGGVGIGIYTAEDTSAITSLKLKRYSGNWIDYQITLFGTCDL